jgi:hypothetical protein
MTNGGYSGARDRRKICHDSDQYYIYFHNRNEDLIDDELGHKSFFLLLGSMMAVRRKDAQELDHGPTGKQPHENNVANSVDAGISASQMVPVLFDYYSVRCCYILPDL